MRFEGDHVCYTSELKELRTVAVMYVLENINCTISVKCQALEMSTGVNSSTKIQSVPAL